MGNYRGLRDYKVKGKYIISNEDVMRIAKIIKDNFIRSEMDYLNTLEENRILREIKGLNTLNDISGETKERNKKIDELYLEYDAL